MTPDISRLKNGAKGPPPEADEAESLPGGRGGGSGAFAAGSNSGKRFR